MRVCGSLLKLSLDIPSTASESHGLEEIKMDSVTIRSTKAQRSLMEWSQRVADCRNSGQPVTRWCAEHGINPKTYYNWQKKVFAAMVEQQKRQMETPKETKPRFAELLPPVVQNNLVAAVRIGEVSLDVYSGASAEVVAALCKVLSNAK
jgi:hypothetical protein